MNVKDTAKIKKDELKVGDVVFVKDEYDEDDSFISKVVKIKDNQAELVVNGWFWDIEVRSDGFWGENNKEGWLKRVSNRKYRGCGGKQYDNFVKNNI